jgi:hypothetical protein
VSSMTRYASGPPTRRPAWARSSASSGAASTPPPRRSGEDCRGCPGQGAGPWAVRSCGPRGQSGRQCRADTSPAAPGGTSGPGRAQATAPSPPASLNPAPPRHRSRSRRCSRNPF